MKYVTEFRDPVIAKQLFQDIARRTTRPWTIMEICGGQTHSIIKNGIDQLLPSEVELVHGPGCPVCVTPISAVDQAIAIAAQPNVILTSFGDMLRVPGSSKDLFKVKSEGGDVRIVYSPLEALKIARENRNKRVVFFAIGFETTAPNNAMAVWQAQKEDLTHFALLVSQVLVPPAIRALLKDPENRVQGYLAPGHVCAVTGFADYEKIAEEFRVPIVVTGFEPIDILQGIAKLIEMLEKGEVGIFNAYSRAVKREGNVAAQKMMQRVFKICNQEWRGIGVLPQSGLTLREEFNAFNAALPFPAPNLPSADARECISGAILQGRKKPVDCPAFGIQCTPLHPLGATMVSSEGACRIYHAFHRQRTEMKS